MSKGAGCLPDDMEANFDEKLEEIDSLLRRWSFRNMTVFGRVSLVKSLALSKLTHSAGHTES